MGVSHAACYCIKMGEWGVSHAACYCIKMKGGDGG